MKSAIFLITSIGFAALTFIYYYFFLKEITTGISKTLWDNKTKSRAKRITWLIPTFILIAVSVWSISGIMADFSLFPANFIPVLALPFIIALVLTFSSKMSDILAQIPPANLIRLQSFRFFVEILLWMLFIDNLLPLQMTFEGRNVDILAGISAPLIAYFANQGKVKRAGLILWNIVCLLFLINIVTIAVLSTPTPIRVFMEEPANTIVTEFPISFLPALLVPLAYVQHMFSLKQLLAAKSAEKVIA